MERDPLRVTMLAPRVFEPPHLGGGERYVSELARALSERDDIELNLYTVAMPAGIARRLPAPTASRAGFAQLLRDARQADILHAQQLNSPAFDLGMALARFARCPLVLTDLGGGWRTPGRALGDRRLRLVDGLAAISKASTTDLGWDTMRPSRTLFGGGEHLLRGADRRDVRATDFLYVGRLLPHKGVDLLIEALPEDRSLRVCGSVADPAFLARLQRLAIGKKVEFSIDTADVSLPSIYAASSFLILPSRRTIGGEAIGRPELLGLVLLEALNCGTPCAGSDLTAIREVLDPVGMPLFKPDDVRALRDTLRSLPQAGSPDHGRYKRLCERGAERYSWRCAAAKSHDLYAELLDGQAG